LKQACAISACGNFAILGTAGGWIEKFNLQSRIHRGVYIDMSESRSCAHDSEVVGVACDSTNTLMISAGYQGDIKVNISCLKALCNCNLLKLINKRS
jgi:U3 small nucleolar RNA-associated protein 21